MARTLTRRHFFEESMIATAAAAAASPEPLAWAGEEHRKTAGDTIHHAILGCRIRGRAHAKAFTSQPNVEVSYVCDPDRRLAHELPTAVEQQQGRRPKEVQDLHKVFDDLSVDTVSIATPNQWHALSAIWAMQAGKDVYVEKPVSNTVKEGRRMAQVARDTGRICQAGTRNRSRGSLAAAGRYIRDGKLGEVTLARTIVYGRRGAIGKRGVYPVPAEVDYINPRRSVIWAITRGASTCSKRSRSTSMCKCIAIASAGRATKRIGQSFARVAHRGNRH